MDSGANGNSRLAVTDSMLAPVLARRANICTMTPSRPPEDGSHPIDWEHLRRAAVQVATRAYAPYSRFPVGAAGLTTSGATVVGCNVENASYGLSLCAECALIANLVSTGGGRLLAVACRHGDGGLLVPCGRCRQLLHEFGGPELLVDAPRGPRPLAELLVDAFGPDDLERP